MRNQIYRMI